MTRGSGGRLALPAGMAFAALLRLVFSRDAVGPMIVADESAYLAMARFLAGRGEIWDLGLASPYNVGYSIFLTPLYRLFEHPEAVYRAAVLLNIAAAALLVPLLERILRRLTAVRRPASVVAATVGACLPSFVVTANRAWSDAVAPLFFALVLLCGIRLLETADRRWASGLIAAQIGAFAMHNRFLVLGLPIVLLLLWLVRSRRLAIRPAVLAVGALALGTVAVRLVNTAIHRRLYEPGGTVDPIRDTLDRLDASSIMISGAGQLWYLLSTTVGLAGLGLIVLIRALAPTERQASAAPRGAASATPIMTADREVAVWITGTVTLSFLVSVVYISGQPMPNHLVYGRYNEPLGIVLVALGSVAVMMPSDVRTRVVDFVSVLLGLAVTTAVVWLPRQEQLGGPFNRSGVIGLSALDAASTQRLRYIALLAAALMIPVVIVALLPARRVLGMALIASVLLPLGADRILTASSFADSGAPASIRTAPLRPDETVHVATGDGLTGLFYRYPFYRDDLRFRRVVDDVWDGGRELVLASATNDDAFAAGYRIIWVDPSASAALWMAPGIRQDAATRANELLVPSMLERHPADDDVELTVEADLDGTRITGLVHVDRHGSGPWAGVARTGFDLRGRVRVAVSLDPPCACELSTTRIDLGRFVPSSQPTLSIPFDIDFSEKPRSGTRVRFQLVREGTGSFGDPVDIDLR